MKASIVVTLAALLLAHAICVSAESVFVSQLTSEGARSNNGPNPFEKKWPFGDNEVTSMGLRQHYLVGYDLKTNYAKNLKLEEIYSPWQVAIRSTNHNVTLMGAQSELEAIFPPNVRPDLRDVQAKLAIPPGDVALIEDDIKALQNKIMPKNFQTLPIHSMDFDKDTVLMGTWCSKIYDVNAKATQDEKWVAEIENTYKDALTTFRTFMKNDNLTIHDIYPYMDGVHASKFNLDNIGTLEAVYDSLMEFRFVYLQQFWSPLESRRIFSTGFTLDLER